MSFAELVGYYSATPQILTIAPLKTYPELAPLAEPATLKITNEPCSSYSSHDFCPK